MDDSSYMALAVELAERGVGWVSPNPLVGAVLVKDGCVIGRGWHERCGGLHAERAALADCREDPAGAVLYVTLEPCCHTGRQPPCTEAILAAGIRRVVVGSMDPNPLVAGKGVELLRTHGVEVETGVLREQCDALNPVFFHYIRTKRPYVVMKYAMTLDGKIAAYTGASRWITREAARRHVHEMRHRYRGILAGVGTVLSDDPLLTCRIPGGRDPVRIICDTSLRTPLDSRIVRTAREVPTILAVTEQNERTAALAAAGIDILLCEADAQGHVCLTDLMEQLGARQIDSILLEGGSSLAFSALESGIVRKVQAYIAPKLIGGAEAKTPVGGAGFAKMADALTLQNLTVTPLGEDFLLEGDLPCSPASSKK